MKKCTNEKCTVRGYCNLGSRLKSKGEFVRIEFAIFNPCPGYNLTQKNENSFNIIRHKLSVWSHVFQIKTEDRSHVRMHFRGYDSIVHNSDVMKYQYI